ncbi:MAG: hypothetical protein ACLGHI_07855 [Gammaproteobacteria bacterium]|jgi:hypothetical protein
MNPLVRLMRNLIGLGAALLCLAAAAETLQMPEAGQADRPLLPQRGETVLQVEERYGLPAVQYPPVGGDKPQHPPITRWDYAGFSVFFENGHVIHAVVQGQPARLHNTEQLSSSP